MSILGMPTVLTEWDVTPSMHGTCESVVIRARSRPEPGQNPSHGLVAAQIADDEGRPDVEREGRDRKECVRSPAIRTRFVTTRS